MIDLKPSVLHEEEFNQLEEISESLNIIKTTPEALCHRDANLLTAEIALKFTVQKLSQKESQISKDLVNSLKD